MRPSPHHQHQMLSGEVPPCCVMLDALPLHIALIDSSGVILWVNQAWEQFAIQNSQPAHHPQLFTGVNYLHVCETSRGTSSDGAYAVFIALRDILAGTASAPFYQEYPCHCPHEQRWFLLSIVGLDYEGQRLALISHLNITRRVLAEQRCQQMALHDALTGLPNRRYLLDSLQEHWAYHARHGGFGALIYMDLDRFKEVNDRLGHAAGDFLLKEVAQRLRHSVRQEDLAARLGGDEFVLLITHLSRDEKTVRREVQRVIDNIKKAFAAPVVYQNELLQIGFSAGIALFPRPEIDLEHSLNQADNALYQAKKLGRGLAVFFDESDQLATKP